MRGHTEEALVIDRRQFVTVAGSLVAACVAPSLRRALATAPPASEVIERLDALFDVFMDERLTKNPDQLTVLGLDKGKYAWARSKLTEASLQWVRESKQDNASRLKRLRAFDRSTLSGADLVNYDTVEFQMETIARTEPFEYGDGVRPYVVSQLTGAYQIIPTFLDRQHRIENREDAEAYLARLRAFAVVLDQETERVRHDAGLKVAPPDFLIERTLEQMRTLHSTEPADSILTTSIAKRTQKLGLQGSYGTDAARIVTAEVYPALERQMQALAELRPGAAQPRRHRGLECFGRPEVGQARRDRARGQAVLDEHHHDGVEHRRLRGRRQAARELEEREVAERRRADEVDETVAAHDDVGGVRPRDVRSQLLALPHAFRTSLVL